MEIQARFTHSKINHTQDTDNHLVVSLAAPSLDWVKERAKICVLPVIDLSGSMRGNKLEYAKKSVLKLIEHLRPGDFAGIYGFESQVHALVPPQEITAEFKEKLKNEVGKLQCLGGTNFSAGLLESIRVMKSLDLPANFVQRVIMFTDGQPTEGVTDPQAILRMMKEALGSTTVSAFGYGSVGGGTWDGCDQDFLTEVSKSGKGNYAYVREPDAALAAFGKELGGLLSAYASDLCVDVEPVNGHQVTKVVTDVEAEEDVTGQVEVKLSDLLAEETRHLVFSVKLAKQGKAFPRESTVFNIKVRYSVLEQDGKKVSKTLEVKAKVQFVKPDDAQKEPDKDVDAIVGLAQMIRAQIEAEELAKQGHYQQAVQVMTETSENLHGRGHIALRQVATNVGARLGSAQLYTANAGYLRSVQSGGTRGYTTSGMDAEAAADLMDASVNLSNNTMDSMVQSFTTPEPLADPDLSVVVQPAVFFPGSVVQSSTSDPSHAWVEPTTGKTPIRQKKKSKSW